MQRRHPSPSLADSSVVLLPSRHRAWPHSKSSLPVDPTQTCNLQQGMPAFLIPLPWLQMVRSSPRCSGGEGRKGVSRVHWETVIPIPAGLTLLLFLLLLLLFFLLLLHFFLSFPLFLDRRIQLFQLPFEKRPVVRIADSKSLGGWGEECDIRTRIIKLSGAWTHSWGVGTWDPLELQCLFTLH